ALLEEMAKLAPAPVRVVVRRRNDFNVERSDSLPLDPLHSDIDPGEAEIGRDSPKPGFVCTGVEQRSDEHVAGDAGDAVDVGDAAHGFTLSARTGTVRCGIRL